MYKSIFKEQSFAALVLYLLLYYNTSNTILSVIIKSSIQDSPFDTLNSEIYSLVILKGSEELEEEFHYYKEIEYTDWQQPHSAPPPLCPYMGIVKP